MSAVRAEADGGVLVVTIDRPEARNAVNLAVAEGIAAALERLDGDDALRVGILTGAGGAFCAGGDVKAMAEGEPRPFDAEVQRQRRSHHATSGRLHRMAKPTIAALPGAAAGAGLSLALACDLRYAAERAFMTTAFARVGFAGDYGGTWFLTRLVGPAKARELYFFADRVPAGEALRLGLVNAVFADEDLEREVLDRVRRLAAGPRLAHRYMKENLNRALTGTLEDALDLEATHHLHTGTTEDHREAAMAFVEKREPVFRGR
jgi:2-(1,2-epoxy-1,2-dihydrophenyl)acetyl-CoA isomerase